MSLWYFGFSMTPTWLRTPFGGRRPVSLLRMAEELVGRAEALHQDVAFTVMDHLDSLGDSLELDSLIDYIELSGVDAKLRRKSSAIRFLSPTRVTLTKPNSEALAQASIVCSSTAHAATIFLQIPFSLSSAKTSAKVVIIVLMLLD